MRQIPPHPSSEDDKEMRKLARTLVPPPPPPSLSSAALPAADWQAGTAETPWHRAGTDVKPAMKDDGGRLFPVIETLVMGGVD